MRQWIVGALALATDGQPLARAGAQSLAEPPPLGGAEVAELLLDLAAPSLH